MEVMQANWSIWVPSAMVSILFLVALALVLILFVHTKIPAARLKGSHDVVGFAYGIIGVIYAVILGFTVVNVQDRFNEAIHIAEEEASTVADLYRDAYVFGPPYTEQIKSNLRNYVQLVLKDEWPLMEKGQAAESVVNNVRDLWYLYYSIEPKTERQNVWLAQSLTKLNDFTSVRLRRVFNSNESLGAMMWFLLYSGAAITIGFLGFFWVENFKVHIFITIALTALIAFMLFLIQDLDTIYDGDIAVKPAAMLRLSEFLDKWY